MSNETNEQLAEMSLDEIRRHAEAYSSRVGGPASWCERAVVALLARLAEAKKERDEAWNTCSTCGEMSSGGAYGCEECSEFLSESGLTHKTDLEAAEAERDRCKVALAGVVNAKRLRQAWKIAADCLDHRDRATEKCDRCGKSGSTRKVKLRDREHNLCDNCV
jgi:hypothetical protein